MRRIKLMINTVYNKMISD